jgi:hypothetical protein
MRSADEFTPAELKGRRIVFKDDEDHAACWHKQVGLRAGVVLRPAQSLAQKAQLLGAEGLDLPEGLSGEEVSRVWVKADPCASFAQGCEAAITTRCLLLPDA